jgi:hypothetical protein
MLFVSKGGSDSTGNGTSGNPYLTIPFALSSIIDATRDKRYAVFVGAGNFAENFLLIANVFILGTDGHLTRLTGTIALDPVSWSAIEPNLDYRSGFQNVALAGPSYTFDFNVGTGSNEGKIYFDTCHINNSVTMIAHTNINQTEIFNSLLFGNYSQQGFISFFSGVCFTNGNTITVASKPGISAFMVCYSGATDGNMIVSSTGTDGASVQLYNFLVANSLSGTGANTAVQATISSVPLTNTFSGGATLTSLNSVPFP